MECFTIHPDHPSLTGHFPGEPVIPGVVLLDHIIAIITAKSPNKTLAGLSQIKFVAKAIIGNSLKLNWIKKNENCFSFSLHDGDTLCVKGLLAWEA
jgi:3-hydroxyacyl-[acyl-carrier-protein] dehydratase